MTASISSAQREMPQARKVWTKGHFENNETCIEHMQSEKSITEHYPTASAKRHRGSLKQDHNQKILNFAFYW